MEPTYDHVKDDLAPAKKQEYWETAFGLQAVDNLKPSRYLTDLAYQHIAGEKTYSEVATEVQAHYDQAADSPEKEADEVSARIYEILADESFRFTVATFQNYHARLFKNLDAAVFHPGEFRTVNLTKKEPILNGDTVQYQNYDMLEETLSYDFAEEAEQDYTKMTDAEKIARLATFTSRIWQVHPFYEGNTRTTAVFIEKYLKNLGFAVENGPFEKHAKYFRNALVRANYNNIPKNISATPEYLENFFENLLLGANHPLDDRELQI